MRICACKYARDFYFIDCLCVYQPSIVAIVFPCRASFHNRFIEVRKLTLARFSEKDMDGKVVEFWDDCNFVVACSGSLD